MKIMLNAYIDKRIPIYLKKVDYKHHVTNMKYTGYHNYCDVAMALLEDVFLYSKQNKLRYFSKYSNFESFTNAVKPENNKTYKEIYKKIKDFLQKNK